MANYECIITLAKKKDGVLPDYAKKRDIENLFKYIKTDKKTGTETVYWSTRGLSRKPKKAAEQVMTLQNILEKSNKRRLYHFVVSFKGDIDLNFIVDKANELANYLFVEHQVFFGVHTDTEHVHVHFAINAVSYVTGKKWHMSRAEYRKWKTSILSITEVTSTN